MKSIGSQLFGDDRLQRLLERHYALKLEDFLHFSNYRSTAERKLDCALGGIVFNFGLC